MSLGVYRIREYFFQVTETPVEYDRWLRHAHFDQAYTLFLRTLRNLREQSRPLTKQEVEHIQAELCAVLDKHNQLFVLRDNNK